MMTKKQKNVIVRIIIIAVLFIPLFVMEHMGFFEQMDSFVLAVVYIIPYLIIGNDIIAKAFKNIRSMQIFDENLLMVIATFAAFGIQEYEEAVAVMLFYQIGELFQSYAIGKSRQSIADLMNICPDYANVEKDGRIIQAEPEDIEIGDIIIIKPGERIPLDGIVNEGDSMLDTSALTGESVPRAVHKGEEVISGCINGNGLLKVRVSKIFEDSTVSKILELVENAGSKKAHIENFITRFARVYTPFVTICALILAVIPPLLTGDDWSGWIKRACIFLVISCPCALVISVPLGFFGGIGAASRKGVLVKGGSYLEAVSQLTTLVFDKTGTLTKGEFKVSEINPVSCSKEELLELAAIGECYSTHPIANSIREAYKKQPDMSRTENVEEIAGKGVHTFIDGKEVYIGSSSLMKSQGISITESDSCGTVVYISVDGRYAGNITVSDALKDGVKEAIEKARMRGIGKCVMLTGDRREAAEYIALELGIDEVYPELMPSDKVEVIEKLIDAQSKDERIAFIGDGINDAPVLSRADIGIAMGSLGSDAAIEAADIVIMNDDIGKISEIMQISAKTMQIVRSSVIFALGVKLIVLILGVLGVANMWAAVFADVGVSVIAILNSMRTLKIR